MLIRRRRSWELAGLEATPEPVFWNRRAFMVGGAALVAGVVSSRRGARAQTAAGPYPAGRNESFKLDRAVTPEAANTDYNNFYEFGSSKHVSEAAQALKTNPWTVKIDGLVERPREVAFEDLLKAMPLEERLYRHRCVEAWSMAVPWTGMPLKSVVEWAKPTSAAKYIQFETFMDPATAPEQKSFFYPWPYVEGLTMAEATNELAFMVTGAYGKALPNVMGAPLRLAVPWKYGFKSVKSIARISFVTERPKTFWQALGPDEYGFWANVNPQVPHPRWSQASEEVLGTSERRPTLLFNGYAEQVAGLYTDLQGEPLFM